jgi:signal transduction histidine kinase
VITACSRTVKALSSWYCSVTAVPQTWGLGGESMSATGATDPVTLVRGLAEMAVTSDLLAGMEDLSEVLSRLAGRAREVTDADYAAISTFDEDGKLNRFVHIGMDEELSRRLGSPPSGRGLLGELVRHQSPIRLEDLKGHATHTGWPEGHPDMGPFLGVPIRAAGTTIGSLYMTREAAREPFSEGNELAALVLALQAAVSLANALARQRSGRIALLEERVMIAQDLHDWTIQSLYALGLEADALSNDPELPQSLRETFAARVEHINGLIRGVRQYITSLEAQSPAASPELSRDLALILRELVPQGVDIVFNISAPALQELASREMEDLISIAREAVSNAVRHGQPTKIAVDLRQSEFDTALTVQDNGVGFDVNAVGRGLGTVTMHTRAQRLSAEIVILSVPGMGSTVRTTLPRRTSEDAPS